MDIEGVLQLLREGLDLGALLQQLTAQAVHFVLQDVDVGHAVLQNVQLPSRLPQFKLQQPQLVQAVPVLQLALVQGALLNLDFLIQQRKLVIAPDELRAQDVPLTNHNVILLLLPQLLLQVNRAIGTGSEQESIQGKGEGGRGGERKGMEGKGIEQWCVC